MSVIDQPRTTLIVQPAHILIELHNEQPVDLLDLTASLVGLAREHEAIMRAERGASPTEETRLLVVDIRKGSTIFELVPALPFFVAQAEVVNTAVDFVRNLSAFVDWLRVPGGRLPDPTTQRLKNLNDPVRAVANDSNGRLDVMARLQSGDVLQEFVIKRDEARLVMENASAQRKEIEHKSSDVYERVLMRLHQTSLDGVKVDARAAEKGIVERIDSRPHTLIYVSELAGQKIKAEVREDAYRKGFVVDLDVETVNGRPRAYRILAVHDVIPLDDE